MRLIDLSHEVVAGMTTYPGLPGPVISDFLSRPGSRGHYANGTEFQIGRIDMVANTGTYVDSPFHRYENGADLSGLRLESIAGLEGLVVRIPEGVTEIGPERLGDCDVRGRAVLFATGWSRHWGSEAYFSGHPFLTAGTAGELIARGAALVGIDSLNIDGTSGGERPVHTLLLAAGIPIVEHLTSLAALPDDGFRFFAVPPKVRGMGTFPVRAFAVTD
jgi:kynurenine formamidase